MMFSRVSGSAALALLAMLGLAQVAQGYIVQQCVSPGMFAMTWDDGPGDYTDELLKILAEKGTKVTFHLTTKYLTDPNIQSIIQRISAAGHLIGLRTDSSWNLFQMSDEQIRSSLARQANVMAQFVGYTPKLIRLPYKGWDERVRRVIESTGAIITTHGMESYDYTANQNRILSAFQLAVSLAGPGQGNFISVQRDSIQQSVAATPQIIDTIKAAGYKMVTLDECIGIGNLRENRTPLDGGGNSMVDLSKTSLTGNSGPVSFSGDQAVKSGIDENIATAPLAGAGSTGGAATPQPGAGSTIGGFSVRTSGAADSFGVSKLQWAMSLTAAGLVAVFANLF